MSPSETHFLSLKQRLKILQFPTLPSQSVHQDISSQQQAMKGCQAQLIGAMRYRMVATPAFFSDGLVKAFIASLCIRPLQLFIKIRITCMVKLD